MKKAVTFWLSCVLSSCSGEPAADSGDKDADTDTDTDSDSDTDTIDTGNPSGELPQVFVNEVMASNATGLQDEVGAFPDWLELYNPNDSEVDISGWWLTQDVTDPFKWQVSDGVTIPAGGYIVIFADDDPEEGPLHASFKISGGGGDDVALFGPNVLDNPLVDSVEDMQTLTSDIALARIPDGGATWQIDNSPSPGASND